jgi:hypothetical protein
VLFGFAVVKVPQDVATLWEKVIESAEIGEPVTPLVTVAVTVEVLEPSAGTLDGLAVTVMMLLTAVWVIGAEPLLPLSASVALTVHAGAPAVVDAV